MSISGKSTYLISASVGIHRHKSFQTELLQNMLEHLNLFAKALTAEY